MAVARNETESVETNGTLEVFVVVRMLPTSVPKDYVARINQATPNSQEWGQWGQLYQPDDVQLIFGLEVGQNLNGTLEVFIWRTQVHHVSQLDPAGAWGEWGTLPEFPGHGIRDLAVARNRTDTHLNGTLEAFASDRPTFGDDEVFHISQTSPSGQWGDWGNLGNPGPSTIFQIAVAQNLNGNLEVFANTSGWQVYHIAQLEPAGLWGEWGLLDSSGAGGGFRAPASARSTSTEAAEPTSPIARGHAVNAQAPPIGPLNEDLSEQRADGLDSFLIAILEKARGAGPNPWLGLDFFFSGSVHGAFPAAPPDPGA